MTAARIRDGHYEVLIDGRFPGGEGVGWVEVPEKAILDRHDNPTGEPIAFWRPHMGVLCFIRATDT